MARGEAGRAFLSRLETILGRAVVASETVTGAPDRGGDWNLRYRCHGDVRTELAFSAAATTRYPAVLAVPDPDGTLDFGPDLDGGQTNFEDKAQADAPSQTIDDTTTELAGGFVFTPPTPAATDALSHAWGEVRQARRWGDGEAARPPTPPSA